MNPDIQFQPFARFTEAAQEAVRRGREADREAAEKLSAHEVTDAAKEVTQGATETAKHLYQLSAVKAEETYEISKEYVRRNPVPVVLGAVAVGAALGYMMMSGRKSTFGEQFVDEPIHAVRKAILNAFAPVKQRVHSGYDLAIDGAGKAMDHLHDFSTGHGRHSLSHRIARIGDNLKFW